ncbi:MAG: DegT/DnrJ/EryC1/StrS family aminotransferase [Myxococcales bacterium]
MEAARSSKTKAVMIAHTLGVPFPVKEVREWCDRFGLWLIEDNCDALVPSVNYLSPSATTRSPHPGLPRLLLILLCQ